MKKYLDEFQNLILEAYYTDLNIIVVKFCHRLQITIQNSIAILSVEYPKDTNFLVWFETAKYIDQV